MCTNANVTPTMTVIRLAVPRVTSAWLRWARRNQALVTLGTASLITVIVGVTFAFVHISDARHAAEAALSRERVAQAATEDAYEQERKARATAEAALGREQ